MSNGSTNPQMFKAKLLLRILKGEYNPFNPTKIIIDEDFLEIRKRNWYLISEDTESFHWEDMNSINVDKHFFGASLILNRDKENPRHGFSKKQADQILELAKPKIHSSSQKGVTNQLADAINSAVNGKGNRDSVSVADELKKLKELLDQDVITQAEFDTQKKTLMEKS